MFIARNLQMGLYAPAERNVLATETLRSAGARVVWCCGGPINIWLLRSQNHRFGCAFAAPRSLRAGFSDLS